MQELPRTRLKATTRKEARDNQRWRILEAMAHLAGKRGYANVSVAQVIERAGVSRKAFYEYFKDREDCFVTAYEELSERLVRDLMKVPAAGGSPGGDEGERSRGGDRTRAQLGRYLEVLARDLSMARAFVVEVMGAGAKSLAARERVNRQFAELVFGHTSKDPIVRKALIAGVNDAVAGALLDKRKLGSLLPSLVKFVSGYQT